MSRKLSGGLLVRLTPLNRGCGLANHVDDHLRLGQHGDVAAVGLDRGRLDAFREKALQIRMDSYLKETRLIIVVTTP